MRKHGLLIGLAFAIGMLPSCNNDEEEEMYPSVITEFVELKTDDQGTMRKMTTDTDITYDITTDRLTGYSENTVYRGVCGYVPIGHYAEIHQLTKAQILRDSTEVATKDPTGVASAWITKRYINLHLTPLTQGGEQHWGFVTDSIVGTNTYISLHHRQNGDPTSYTKDIYASLPLAAMENTATGDSIILRIKTFTGEKTWRFRK